MIATGVARGSPLFRPRIVISPLKPSGTRAARRNLAIGVKLLTCRGALAVGAAARLGFTREGRTRVGVDILEGTDGGT